MVCFDVLFPFSNTNPTRKRVSIARRYSLACASGLYLWNVTRTEFFRTKLFVGKKNRKNSSLRHNISRQLHSLSCRRHLVRLY